MKFVFIDKNTTANKSLFFSLGVFRDNYILWKIYTQTHFIKLLANNSLYVDPK